MPVRVLVGEDNYLAREGIERILNQTDDVTHIGTCADLDTLRAAVAEASPEVVLTDIRMPPTHTDEGLRLAAELRATHPEVGVVILTQHAEPAYAMALFAAGTERRGYLLKERLSSQDELRQALLEVAAGRSYLDSGLVGPILDHHKHSDPRLRTLTQREVEILTMVAEGRSNAAIAEAAGVTVRAVERHINSIFAKVGLIADGDVNRRVKATRLFLDAAAADVL
jgi:DNA-binding NarL/FixJ family response regulator